MAKDVFQNLVYVDALQIEKLLFLFYVELLSETGFKMENSLLAAPSVVFVGCDAPHHGFLEAHLFW